MQNALSGLRRQINREAPHFQGARGDEETLETRKLAETDDTDNPTFLSVTPDGSLVYANSEVFAWREGTVSAYRFDRQTATLSYVNKQPALGSITAHNAITRDGAKLLVANYGFGEGGPDRSVVVFGFREDGGLTAPLSSVAHTGTGPDPARQERPHAHSVTETIAGGMAIVADLGIDRLVSYRIGADGSLTRLAEPMLTPGAGPRHVALHPGGRLVFVMNELDSTVASLALDEASGKLTLIDTKPAVPAEGRDGNHCADIQISPMAASSTVPIAAMTASWCLRSTSRRARLRWSATPAGRDAAQPGADAVRRPSLLGQPECRPHLDLRRDSATGLLTNTGRSIDVGTPMCVEIVR